mgnify:CR=1 FL=1
MAGAGIGKRMENVTLEAARARVVEALKAEGFGVLTEIDMTATMKAKIGADIRPYRILGACNPPLAHKAISANPEAGLMMPCNVILYGDGDDVVVTAVDPTQVPVVKGQPAMEELATEVKARLARVIGAA